MSTRILYFFCQSCGADTATYESYSSCPYCRASHEQFQLIAETTNADEPRDQIQHQIETLRAKWISEHKSANIGSRKSRRFFGRR